MRDNLDLVAIIAVGALVTALLLGAVYCAPADDVVDTQPDPQHAKPETDREPADDRGEIPPDRRCSLHDLTPAHATCATVWLCEDETWSCV